ncbi:hypothetical protein QIW52_18150 [Clostridioides difficile]|nr:hypothetical protein [Clostridioides difficile]
MKEGFNIKTNYKIDARPEFSDGRIRIKADTTVEIISNKQTMRFDKNGNVYYNDRKIGTDKELFKYIQIFFKSYLE